MLNPVTKEFLFRKHILVSNGNREEPDFEKAFSSMIALKREFGIEISDGFELANEDVVREAEYFLGEYVPEAFYRGFPNSVRALTTEQRLFDQLLHYSMKNGMQWCYDVEHSTMETILERVAFNESVTPKEFVIVDENQAEQKLTCLIKELLENKRSPLNAMEREVVFYGWDNLGPAIIPQHIACKKTVIELLHHSKSMIFESMLDLPDVIKLLEYILYVDYGTEKTNQLNLKNRDRKLLTNVIDNKLLIASYDDKKECFEKRKIWCGLLHHLHYKPKNAQAKRFVDGIRNGENWSSMSEFEKLLNSGNPVMAANQLKCEKGKSALLRNLNYILSRCKNEDEVREVLENV